jgi:hypothetical protein
LRWDLLEDFANLEVDTVWAALVSTDTYSQMADPDKKIRNNYADSTSLFGVTIATL